MSSTIPLVVPVRFSGGGLSMQTTTSRISADGVFLRCLLIPKDGAPMTLALSLPGSARPLNATGTVARGDQAGKDHGFWVRFDELPDDVRTFLDVLLRGRGVEGTGRPAHSAETNRAYARVPARLRVGWTSAHDFLVAYSENISRGGIFIATDNPPPLREIVDLSVELPDGKPAVKTQAEVVHCVTVDQARSSGRPAGAGLQFIGATDEFRQRLDACIEALAD
jgi:uncharacterized protein (TIGR02266 family)